MNHFYSEIQGNRGPVTRGGSKASGITANANGWDIGGTVNIKYNKELDTDVVSIYTTKGSNFPGYKKPLVSYAYIKDKFTIIDTSYPELLI